MPCSVQETLQKASRSICILAVLTCVDKRVDLFRTQGCIVTRRTSGAEHCVSMEREHSLPCFVSFGDGTRCVAFCILILGCSNLQERGDPHFRQSGEEHITNKRSCSRLRSPFGLCSALRKVKPGQACRTTHRFQVKKRLRSFLGRCAAACRLSF